MGFDIIHKGENTHRRVDGSGVPPFIRHVVGNATEYQQGWKAGHGENWPMGESRPAAKTNAFNEAFFKRSKG